MADYIAQVGLSNIVPILFFLLALVIIYKGAKLVPQSDVYVVERFGKYTKTLDAGLNFIVPFLDNIAHRVSILERQLAEFSISVITRDNVEVGLEATVFFRVLDASRSVYRIRDINGALHTAATSIVRSAAGKLELDELQSSREKMSAEIAKNLQEAAEIWGIEITRTEITDVIIDEKTKDSQRQQLNAEREKRASIARAEGEKRSVELNAEAKFFEAERLADAVRVTADADAYAVKIKAEADAEQTRLVAAAINENGQGAINFEIMKRQVDAMAAVASSPSSKTVIMPSDITKTIGTLQLLMENLSTKD